MKTYECYYVPNANVTDDCKPIAIPYSLKIRALDLEEAKRKAEERKEPWSCLDRIEEVQN